MDNNPIHDGGRRPSDNPLYGEDMPLSDSDRQSVWADWMRANYGPVAVTKPQLRAAVNAADDWVTDNIADFTAALPESLRTHPAPTVLLANAACIASGRGPANVSEGIAPRTEQAGALLVAYVAASEWLTAQATDYLTAIAVAGAGALTQAQSFAVLESVCRRRAV